jgi:hypothetical protein
MPWKTQGEATSIHSDVKMVKEEMIHAATYSQRRLQCQV